jgi:hypothetical protein
MNAIYLIASIYIIILITGVLCAIYYLYKEKGITNTKEFLHLLFFAPTGLGNWKYNSLTRNNEPTEKSKNWHIYTNMIRINWCIIAILLVYETYTFYHLYQFFTHYNELKKEVSTTIGRTASDILYSLFGWMINWSINIVIAYMAIILLGSFLACFILFIVIPKFLLKDK